MSKTTIALEAAVASVIENSPTGDARPAARQRANVDKAFATILKLIAPRIRHFIRQYGLAAHWDDAEQCCAIAVHRAIQAYEPEKAQFTTFVNWQIRGELQSLRFRLMTDQRPSAKKVEATTVSLHSLSVGAEGEENSLESIIEDETALAQTEAAASDFLAKRATQALLDEYVSKNRAAALDQLRRRPQPKRIATAGNGPRLRTAPPVDPVELEKLDQKLARDRDILERRVFDDATLDDVGTETGITKERIRQISKRAVKSMAELAVTTPKFAVMADYGLTAGKMRPAAPVAQPAASILADGNALHNRTTRVVAIDPQEVQPASSPSAERSNPGSGVDRIAA